MEINHDLIQKNYYKQLIQETASKSEYEQLSLLLLNDELDDNQKSEVRFGQGELNFIHQDYETAIFKWEKVEGQWQNWAKKNIADAYDQLGLLKDAKRMYQSIKTQDETLKTEVFLQLFSIYIEQEKLDDAAETIKKAVQWNPDYPNVTVMAKQFFEEYRDYSSAIELAVDESIRTGSIEWFDKVKSYVKQGLTKTTNPSYFMPLLTSLHSLNLDKYEELVTTLWDSYHGEELYFDWLLVFNTSYANILGTQQENLALLSNYYQVSYFEMISGTYFLKEIEAIIPLHIRNWFMISSSEDQLLSVTAVLSWNDMFPEQIEEEFVHEAKEQLEQVSGSVDWLEKSLVLFQEIESWAKKHDLMIGQKYEWVIKELLQFNQKNLMVAGTLKGGKNSFLEGLIGSSLEIEENHHSLYFIKEGKDSVQAISNEEDFALTDEDSVTNLIEIKTENHLLREMGLQIIDSPVLSRNQNQNNSWKSMINFADHMVFVLNGNHPFTNEERTFLLEVKKEFPDLAVHFIFNKLDGIYSEHEEGRILAETKSRINEYFSDAKVLSFSPKVTGKKEAEEITGFIKNMLKIEPIEQRRNKKILYFIKEVIGYLYEQRTEMEKQYLHSVSWNEEMVEKLKAAHHQVNDLEKEESQSIKNAYQEIKNEMETDIKNAVPSILKECKDLIREDTNFKTLPEQINREATLKLNHYFESKLIPKFSNSFSRWLEVSNVAFIRSQSYLKEMAEGFNSLYESDQFLLEGDFRILDDWQRDIERLSTSIQLEHINLFNKMTPSQLVLKSSGKWLGSITANKSLLYKMYMKFFEGEDFSQIADNIASQFMMQFELFERGLTRDIQMFFKKPYSVVQGAIQEAQSEIEGNNEAIGTLKSNPEVYRDPLTLFQLRVHQYEWVMRKNKTLAAYI
ncbi:putative GTPase [Bacillus sp. TS-2]|nr:putative GTPase [Bacillus sp. TS-2]